MGSLSRARVGGGLVATHHVCRVTVNQSRRTQLEGSREGKDTAGDVDELAWLDS